MEGRQRPLRRHGGPLSAPLAQLSKGWVDGNALVCPYHGWASTGSGTCVRVPQRPNSGGLKGTAVETFACTERYGHIWVALDEPLAPIPDWTEETDPAYRRIDQFYEPWNCAGFPVDGEQL